MAKRNVKKGQKWGEKEGCFNHFGNRHSISYHYGMYKKPKIWTELCKMHQLPTFSLFF